MSPRASRRFRHLRNGGIALRLSKDEKALLASLPEEVEILLADLSGADPSVPEELRRLFPPAYLSDDQAESSYRTLLGESLVERHRSCLRVLREMSEATQLDAEEADAWLIALNDLRLVLGSRLKVTEETREFDIDDPSYGAWICYQYLSFLQSELLDALFLGLPDAHDDGEIIEDPWGEPPGGLRWDGTPLPSD